MDGETSTCQRCPRHPENLSSILQPTPCRRRRSRSIGACVNSPGFVSSVRLCRFLTHVVHRTLDGDIDSLKELSIAMEVFDRTSDYDPNIDAIVRVEARRLRAKLKAYYEEGQGTVDPVLIGLRPGSYVPVFRWLDTRLPKHRAEIGATIPSGRTSIAVSPFVNPSPTASPFCDRTDTCFVPSVGPSGWITAKVANSPWGLFTKVPPG
jgi:adenylate cyclase